MRVGSSIWMLSSVKLSMPLSKIAATVARRGDSAGRSTR